MAELISSCFPKVKQESNFGLFRAGYIYVLICPDTGLVRYVGKTFNPNKRFYDHCHFNKRNTKRNKKNNWVYGLNQQGKKPIIEIIDGCDEFNWEEKEKSFIKMYKSCGADLLNMTNGGEPGSFNMKHSEEARKAISEALKKRPPCKIRNANIREGILARHARDPEYKNKLSKRFSEAASIYRSKLTDEEKASNQIKSKIAKLKKSRFSFCHLVKAIKLVKSNNLGIKQNLITLGMTPYDWDNLKRVYIKRSKHNGIKYLS